MRRSKRGRRRKGEEGGVIYHYYCSILDWFERRVRENKR